jgi:hypothetical protein
LGETKKNVEVLSGQNEELAKAVKGFKIDCIEHIWVTLK